MLEGQMQDLRNLPERVANVELQFVQLRQEMRDGFSAIRSEMKEGFEELSAQMRMLHEDTISRMATMAEGRRSK